MKKGTFLFVTKDLATVQGLLPIADQLKERGHSIQVVCEGLSSDIWIAHGYTPAFVGSKNFVKEPFAFPWNDIDGYLLETMPDVVVTGLSNPINLEDAFVAAAIRTHIPIVCYEDIWGGHARLSRALAPDAFLTLDKVGRDLILENRRFAAVKTVVCGNIGVVKAVEREIPQATKDLVDDYGVRGYETLLFAGQAPEYTDSMLDLIVASIMMTTTPCVLIPRFHPKLFEEFGAGWMAKVNALKAEFPNRIALINEKAHKTDDLAVLCDVTVSACSGVLLTSAAAGRTPISALTSSGLAKMRQDLKLPTIEHYPPVDAGVVLELREAASLDPFLGRTAPMTHLRIAQRRYFDSWSPKSATELLESLAE